MKREKGEERRGGGTLVSRGVGGTRTGRRGLALINERHSEYVVCFAHGAAAGTQPFRATPH